MALREAETAGKEAAVRYFKADLLLCGVKRVGAVFGSTRDNSGKRIRWDHTTNGNTCQTRGVERRAGIH